MKLLAVFLLAAALLTAACGNEPSSGTEKVFRYGTTAYGIAHENTGMDVHENYQGWSAIRYGVGETLFKFDDAMQPQPWLAESYRFLDDYTVEITLKDNIYFTSGNKMTGAAVKACFEDLISRHNRAQNDLRITNITADGQKVTITSAEKVPVLINYLCDPYGCIIDMSRGTDNDINISGTGPFIVQSLTPKEIVLVKNKNYWGGTPQVDKIIVTSITDGNTLTMALQNGEIDAAQGLPYASLNLFSNNSAYKISSTETSRTFQACMNFTTPALQDKNVRQAIALAIDRDTFAKVQLMGNGTPAQGAFPADLAFGGDKVRGPGCDPEKARALLTQSGWTDTDGDGYVDKNGTPLTLRWLTYTSRQELPLLAEAAQSWLKGIGVKLEINPTDGYNDYLRRGEWDIYAKAFVTAPTGDAQYYFTTHVLQSSAYNNGKYYNPVVEALTEKLRSEFDPARRAGLAVQINQQLIDDAAFIYASHLKMSLVMKNNIGGFAAHPCDYYEITKDLTIN